jgi:hypothetical protein
MRGRVVFPGGAPENFRIIALKGLPLTTGGFGADDVPVASITQDKEGTFQLLTAEKPPLVLGVSAPGYEEVTVVLATCRVEVDFYMARERTRP